MSNADSKHRGFVAITVLGIVVLIVAGASLIFEAAQAIHLSTLTQRAATSGALAGLYAYKRSQLRDVEALRDIVGDTVSISVVKQEEIKSKAREDARMAAAAIARSIAGHAAQVSADYTNKTIRVEVVSPYRPLFFKIATYPLARTAAMSFKN